MKEVKWSQNVTRGDTFLNGMLANGIINMIVDKMISSELV